MSCFGDVSSSQHFIFFSQHSFLSLQQQQSITAAKLGTATPIKTADTSKDFKLNMMTPLIKSKINKKIKMNYKVYRGGGSGKAKYPSVVT
ncbi:MAG: hypothetical protein NVS3B3_07340 [Aquirhabdus sp.]